MSNYAVVDASGNIVNRIVLDDPKAWTPPEGYSVHEETKTSYEIGATLIDGIYKPLPVPPAPPPAPAQILSQDLMAQFTTDDLTKIKAAVEGNIQFWGLWSAMQAQKDPMVVTNARFLAGWGALTQVLGKSRMDAIAQELGVTVG